MDRTVEGRNVNHPGHLPTALTTGTASRASSEKQKRQCSPARRKMRQASRIAVPIPFVPAIDSSHHLHAAPVYCCIRTDGQGPYCKQES